MQMTTGGQPAGLQLTEEEAFTLLVMCLMSPYGIDKTAESALRKLAEYCAKNSTNNDSSIDLLSEAQFRPELRKAGA
jgi:endonuclease III